MYKKIISFIVYIVLVYDAIKILFGEQIKKKFMVHSRECVDAEIVEFKSKEEMYNGNLGRTMNEFWSIVEYEYVGKSYKKKVQRSKYDYLGRRIRIYITFDELDLREKYEFPHMDIGRTISVVLPIVLIVFIIVYFILV